MICGFSPQIAWLYSGFQFTPNLFITISLFSGPLFAFEQAHWLWTIRITTWGTSSVIPNDSEIWYYRRKVLRRTFFFFGRKIQESDIATLERLVESVATVDRPFKQEDKHHRLAKLPVLAEKEIHSFLVVMTEKPSAKVDPATVASASASTTSSPFLLLLLLRTVLFLHGLQEVQVVLAMFYYYNPPPRERSWKRQSIKLKKKKPKIVSSSLSAAAVVPRELVSMRFVLRMLVPGFLRALALCSSVTG